MKNNKISIVIPSYNQGKFIESTILSILNQRYSNKEIIIIDGGSSDDTVLIIKKYESQIFYWVSEKDEGQSHAIKKGFDIATGDIFCWLNSDDEYCDDTLFLINTWFEKYKCDLVYGNMNIIDEQGRLISKRYLTPFLPKFIRNAYLCGGFGIYQPSSFWTKELYIKSGGIDVEFKFCMDNDLFNKFIVNDGIFVFLNKEISNFRIHNDSKTSNLFEIANKERYLLYNKYVIQRNLNYKKLLSFSSRLFRIFHLLILRKLHIVIWNKYFNKYKWVP
jgi:glycosyltransferase involved in cell wall biosynthesis